MTNKFKLLFGDLRQWQILAQSTNVNDHNLWLGLSSTAHILPPIAQLKHILYWLLLESQNLNPVLQKLWTPQSQSPRIMDHKKFRLKTF